MKHLRINAVCPDCKFLGSLGKPWKVPVREMDENGKKSKIVAFKVYDSGCLCGPPYEEPVDERSGYKLNLAPSWRRLRVRQ